MKYRMITAHVVPEAKKFILDKLDGGPQYSKLYCHHVTIIYGPSQEETDKYMAMLKPNEEVFIHLGRRFWANGVEAIEAKVLKKDGSVVPIKNTKPHITISTDGKAPKFSNDMLNGTGEFTDGFEGAQLIGAVVRGVIVFE
jgi:hypothetical protein